MFKRYRFVVALVLCLCVFAYDTVSISSDLGGRSFAWADDPTFNGNALVLSGQLGLYFYLSNAVAGKMTFTIATSPALTTEELEFDGNNAKDDGSIIQADDNSFGFRCNVTSIQMADTITAAFTPTGQSAIQNESNIKSVKDYLDKLVETSPYSGYTNLKNLVNAIRDYGHYAQLALDGTNKQYSTSGHTLMARTDPNAADIAVNSVTKTTVVPAPKKTVGESQVDRTLEDYKITVSGGSIQASEVSYALDLDSNTALHVYIPSSKGTTATAKVQKVTESGTPITRDEYTDATDVEKDDIAITTGDSIGDESYTVISFSGIPAHEIDNIYTITINSTTITISPLTYVYAVLQMTYPEDEASQEKLKTDMGIDSKDELDELKRAVIAFYNYYEKTLAYRANKTQ